MNLLKLSISVTCVASLLINSGCSSMEWTDKEFLDEFQKACNPNNLEGEKRWCDCTIDKLKARYPQRADYAALSQADSDKVYQEVRKECMNWDIKTLKDAFMKDCNNDGSKLAFCTCQHKGLAKEFPLASQFTKLNKDEQAEKEKEIAEQCLTWDVMGADMIRKFKMDKGTSPLAECLVEQLQEKFPTFDEFAEAENDGLMESVIYCSAKAKEKEDAENAEDPPPEEE